MNQYETDNDFLALITSNVTDELLLNFFFQKDGIVNMADACYLSVHNRQTHLNKNFASLHSQGLIKKISESEYQLTGKAKWIKFYKHPSWGFWAFIVSVVAVIVAVLAVIVSISIAKHSV